MISASHINYISYVCNQPIAASQWFLFLLLFNFLLFLSYFLLLLLLTLTPTIMTLLLALFLLFLLNRSHNISDRIHLSQRISHSPPHLHLILHQIHNPIWKSHDAVHLNLPTLAFLFLLLGLPPLPELTNVLVDQWHSKNMVELVAITQEDTVAYPVILNWFVIFVQIDHQIVNGLFYLTLFSKCWLKKESFE